MIGSGLEDQLIDTKEVAQLAHRLHVTCEGTDRPAVIAALIAELITQLIGPVQWTMDQFTKVVSEIAQAVQVITWTIDRTRN